MGKEKDVLVALIKEALNEISIYMGTSTLKAILERISFDLSVYNSAWEHIKTDDPKEIDFSSFSINELKKFYYMFVDIVGNMLGDEFREDLLKKLERRDS